LHARSLYDFFFVPPRKNSPDVSIQQFFEDGQAWRPEPAQLCPYLQRERERLNPSIQHLSYDRLDYEPNKEWNVRTIVTEITTIGSEFLGKLPPERRAWFETASVTSQQHCSALANLCAKTQPSGIQAREVRSAELPWNRTAAQHAMAAATIC